MMKSNTVTVELLCYKSTLKNKQKNASKHKVLSNLIGCHGNIIKTHKEILTTVENFLVNVYNFTKKLGVILEYV